MLKKSVLMCAVVLAGCGGGGSDVQPTTTATAVPLTAAVGSLSNTTFTTETLPARGLYIAWIGQIQCEPFIGEPQRQAKLAQILKAGINIQSTACAAQPSGVQLAMCNLPVLNYWLVESTEASPAKMAELGFEVFRGLGTGYVAGPCTI